LTLAEDKYQCHVLEIESSLAQKTENSRIIDDLKNSLSLAEDKHQCQIKELDQMTENLKIAGEENEEKYQCEIKELISSLNQKTEDLRIIGEENDALKLSLISADEKHQCQIKELESLQMKAQTSNDRVNELEYLREHLQSSFDQACSDCERYRYIYVYIVMYVHNL
jgi:chromosome segregation ATPase